MHVQFNNYTHTHTYTHTHMHTHTHTHTMHTHTPCTNTQLHRAIVPKPQTSIFTITSMLFLFTSQLSVTCVGSLQGSPF